MVNPETLPHPNLLPYQASLEAEQVLFTQEGSVRAELCEWGLLPGKGIASLIGHPFCLELHPAWPVQGPFTLTSWPMS